MLIYETKKEHNALNICIDESNPTNIPDVVITKDEAGKTNIQIDGSSSSPWQPGPGKDSAQLANTLCIARGEASVAEGWMSVAGTTETIEDWREGKCAHAEGGNTTAAGNYSHSEGNSTVANNPYEHAEGHFNYSHADDNPIYPSANNTIHSIGIGSNISNRKNAIEVMQNGDVYILGIGGYDGTNISTAQTLQEVIESLLNK